MKILTLLFLIFVAFITKSIAAVDCAEVERIGNEQATQIRRDLDAEFDGREYSIGGLGRLELEGVKSIKFNKCDVKMWVKLSIERPVFGTASGKSSIEGVVYEFSNSKVCLKNIEVTKMDLSNSSSSSREAYRSLANKAIKNKNCYKIKL